MGKVFPLILLFILFSFCAVESISQPLSPGVLYGRVVGVTDGDTATILVNKKPVTVRLSEIDAPERRQAYGSVAKQALSKFIFGKDVKVVVVKKSDRYGRVVGRVSVGKLDVNAEMVRFGYAWAYSQYITDASIIKIEQEAKAAKRGLWADKNPVAPWAYRKSKK